MIVLNRTQSVWSIIRRRAVMILMTGEGKFSVKKVYNGDRVRSSPLVCDFATNGKGGESMNKRMKVGIMLLFSMLLIVLITACVGVFQVGPWTITITNTSGAIIDLYVSSSSEGPWVLQDSYFAGGPYETQPIAHGTIIRIYRRLPIDQSWWWDWGGGIWRDYWQVNESFSVTITHEIFIAGEHAAGL